MSKTHDRSGPSEQPSPSSYPTLTTSQRFVKRLFDISASLAGLTLCWWLIALAWLVAAADARANGFFVQRRVGRHGQTFPLVKIRTMRTSVERTSTVTVRHDPRITASGRVLRRWKIDELPQLLNVLVGQMSIVGPRPDVPGFADVLTGEERSILELRPGVTGPASLRYRHEEELLASQDDPESFNRDVIYPEKVRLNLEYLRTYSFRNDLRILALTFLP